MRARLLLAFALGALAGAIGAGAVLSRYSLQTAGNVIVRMDRCTGRVDMTMPTMTYWQEAGVMRFDPDAYLEDRPQVDPFTK